MTLKIGTRGSALALYQARTVASALQAHGASAEIVVIRTSGDRLADAVLSEVGGKGLFVKEIEEALLRREVDLAVHSSKDLPNELPPELGIRAVLPRADPRDALVLPAGSGAPADFQTLAPRLTTMPPIGTSSVRRIAQLRRALGGGRFLPVRGNLDTRLRKLDTGEYGALVLAAAGLLRLEYGARISAFVPLDVSIPAPGQGIIAIETRRDDASTNPMVAALDDAEAAVALTAERAVVARLGGGCQLPIGAHAEVHGDRLRLQALVIAPDASREARTSVEGPSGSAEALGRQAADVLLANGGDEILTAVRRVQTGNGMNR